ncbi:MAG: hypothetical protein AB7I38_16665 [Dehalococcoidia bacterium]
MAVVRKNGGGLRTAFTLTDQLVSSASNFALGVLVARTGGPDALGAFSIAFLAWLAIMGANRALVAEPMIIAGRPEGAESDPDRGLPSALLVGGLAAAALVLIGGGLHAFGVPQTALLALAPWIPSLLAQDYFRWMAFRLQRPQQALISDVVFIAVQAAVTWGLFMFGQLNVGALIAAWGIGATAGAVVGFAICGERKRVLRNGAVHLRELWCRSRWLLAEFATSFVATQGYLILLPILLSTSEFGLYRAGASLITPVALLFTVALNVGLPESVRRLRADGPPGVRAHAARLTTVVVAVTIGYCGIIALIAPALLPFVYGDEFAEADIITLLTAISYAISSSYVGYCIALKAVGELQHLWTLRVLSAAASIVSTVLLAKSFGLVGAGYASILADSVYAVGAIALYYRTFNQAGRPGQSGSRSSQPDDAPSRGKSG